jgi:AraC family transcriptional regulator, transcriptional activator of pobA
MQEITALKDLVATNTACYAEYRLFAEVNHFNVFNQSEICERTRPMHRSDFYKISLINGTGILQIKDEYIEINGHVLIFFNPTIPYFWQSLSETTPSYYCYFDNYFQSKLLNKEYFQESALFTPGTSPVFALTDDHAAEIRAVFEDMYAEIQGDYHHKYDILATYLQLLLQKAFKIQNNSHRTSANKSASIRIISNFFNLLEKQFPIDSVEHPLRLKTPKDFAEELSIHVNYLNHAVKELSGRKTSEIIASRVITEAKALLKHSNADVAEIAYMLGFEYPNNFITFFKRHTKETPKSFRNNANMAVSKIQNI